MAKGRNTKSCRLNHRRCFKCKKIAKDFIDGEYLCRIHSPIREGFEKAMKIKKKKLIK